MYFLSFQVMSKLFPFMDHDMEEFLLLILCFLSIEYEVYVIF